MQDGKLENETVSITEEVSITTLAEDTTTRQILEEEPEKEIQSEQELELELELESELAPELEPKPESKSEEINIPLDPFVTTNDLYDEFFANSIFVGDSVMEGFAQYIRLQRNNGVTVLSNAKFLTSTMGIKVSDITGDNKSNKRSYVYKGEEQALEIIIKNMGVKRVFIMLGMNDLAVGLSTDVTIERYRKMILIIKEANPELDVVVLTTTPKTATKWLPNYISNKEFGSPLLNEFADKLKTMCEEDGIKVIDINSAVRGENGHLPDKYSRDNYVHINNECSALVLDTIRNFAKSELEV